jgi:hypothetical protein
MIKQNISLQWISISPIFGSINLVLRGVLFDLNIHANWLASVDSSYFLHLTQCNAGHLQQIYNKSHEIAKEKIK